MYGRLKLITPRRIAILTTAALSFVHFSFLGDQEAHAAGIKHLDQIRVALVINATKYKKLEPLVSLSSPGGFDISVRSTASAQAKPWTSSADAVIRLSLDQYSTLMLETSDFTAAKSLYAKLAAMPQDSYVLSRMKSGKMVYQVYYGNLPTKAEAESAAGQALKDATVAALTKSGIPTTSGPLHVSAGVFASEAAAQQQINVYTQAGILADLVLQEDSAGKVGFQVWLGSEATDVNLEAVKQAALKAAPNTPLQPANTNSPYLIRRSDVTSSSSPSVSSQVHYAAAVGEQKTVLQPKKQGISVHENSDRKYRGNMEISTYHDRLALVNEVPMEQYLYGVLGAELSAQWPAEALKAQAVAARTFAIVQGNKYEIAQLTDTTLDQAYFGMDKEFSAGNLAVDATKDEVISDKRGLISPVFASNAGGQTADPSEVWGNPVDYLRSVASPDEGAEQGKALWYQVQLTDGRVGYVHSMYLKDTGQTNKTGQAYFEATEQDVNVRLAPYVDNVGNPGIAKLATKEKVAILGQAKESNAYSWIRGPFTMSEIKSKLQAANITINGDLTSLEVSKRGPSGRAIELKVNGVVVKDLPYPDAIRSAIGGLPSTLFEIEGAGSYTGTSSGTSSSVSSLSILGHSTGVSSSTTSDSIYVLSANQSQPIAVKKTDLITLSSSGISKPTVSTGASSLPSKPATTLQGNQIIFRGKGYGHGLGMSQWGAKGFAEQGYDYKKILQTYYAGVNITKE